MTKRGLSRKAKRIIFIAAAVSAVLAAVAFIAADRYLIEHVEIDLGKNMTQPTGMPATGGGTEEAAVTGTSYVSASKSVTIRKVTTGSGKNQVVYFVADVCLADVTQLQSAFAKNRFGTNIIEYPSEIAADNNAIFAVNGDYYGFRSDGIVIRDGVLYRDEPARQGLCIYKDGRVEIYDETETTGEALVAQGAWQTLSFGPALVENGEIVSGIEDVEVDTNFGNHSIQGNQPRTGIGVIDENHFVFVVVDGRSAGYSKGVTLTGFARIFKELGCTAAYNLDGGGSSEMVFMGEVVNNPLGRNRERGTSDILFIA